MPSTPRETFLSLPDEVLQGLAQAHGVDPTRYPNRDSLIEALASLPGAEDLVPEASRRRMAYQLDRLRPRQLRELGERHRVVLHGLKRKAALLEPCDADDPEAAAARVLLDRAREAFFRGQREDETLLRDLVRAAEAAHAREANRVRDLLASTRDGIREAANLGASVALAEDSWKRAADFLDRDQLAAAREGFVESANRAGDARRRRIREVEESIGSVSDHIEVARNVGADIREAQELHEAAKAAIAASEHGRAGDLLKRAERLAMKGQQRQIDRAMQLRQAQIEKAQAVLGACEPILKEAESYDLSAAEVRTLLRQARDVLAKGDYLAGLTFAKNAEEASQLLEAQIADERRHRGIEKPSSGICGVCRSRRVVFEDDGWGRCEDCGITFRWRGPLGVWERLRALLAA